jgi:hypothetical protein
MIEYSLKVLDADSGVKYLKQKMSEAGGPNAVKVIFAQMVSKLEDARKCQILNTHRNLAFGECSCGLSIDVPDDERFDITEERLFRTRGHIDHTVGNLTKLFVRKWPAVNTRGEFFCWWCVECGYQGNAGLGSKGEVQQRLLHECRSELYRRDLLRMLRASYVRIGHAHWNNATKSFADKVEFTLDSENEFIEFRQIKNDDVELDSWIVFCTVCDEQVSEPLESENDKWLYEYRERHRDEHISGREISWHKIDRQED